jgi:MFS family permease
MERKWWTLVAVCVATLMLLIDVTIVNVALPNIQSALHANFSDVQWVVDAYSLLLAALLLTAGSLGRPLRASTCVRHRPDRVHRELAAVRPGNHPAVPQPRPGRAGRGRRDAVRHLARVARPDVPWS